MSDALVISLAAPQTCPSCGAEKRTYYYGCWTRVDDPMDRHADCYQRQIAAQAAEIKRLKEVLGNIGDKAHDFSTAHAVGDGYWDIRRMAYDAI